MEVEGCHIQGFNLAKNIHGAHGGAHVSPQPSQQEGCHHHQDRFKGRPHITQEFSPRMALKLAAGQHGGHEGSTVYQGGKPYNLEKIGQGSARFTDYAVRDQSGQYSGYATGQGDRLPEGAELQLGTH